MKTIEEQIKDEFVNEHDFRNYWVLLETQNIRENSWKDYYSVLYPKHIVRVTDSCAREAGEVHSFDGIDFTKVRKLIGIAMLKTASQRTIIDIAQSLNVKLT